MNRQVFFSLWSFFIINCFTENVENTSQCLFTYRHRNRAACSDSLHTTHKTISRSHGNTADSIITQMLSNFNNKC